MKRAVVAIVGETWPTRPEEGRPQWRETMEQTLISHPKLRVQRRTGSEGPSNDPYGYEELRARTPMCEAVLHRGLVTWLELKPNRARQPVRYDFRSGLMPHGEHEQFCCNLFELAVGFTITQLERMHRKRTERCKCGSRATETVAGFPGETFIVCADCGEHRDSWFDRSAVE